MTYQNATPRGVEVLDVPYRPPTAALPIETFTLASLVHRMARDEFTSHQRLQFDLLVCCTAGRGNHEVDFERIELVPGRVLHIRAGQVHRWFLDRPYDARLVPLQLPRQRTDWRPGAHVIDTDGELRIDLERVLDLADRSGRSTPLSLRSLEAVRDLLVSLLGLDQPGRDDTTPVDLLFSDFERLLAEADPTPRSVRACARRIGCSTRTLTRACNAVVGVPPKVLVDRAVALEAQRRLSVGDSTVAAVAESLGFAELSNFTRFFRRVTGETPSDFVASYGAGVREP